MSIRIKCPDSGLDKNERIIGLFDGIQEWLDSNAMKELVDLYGGMSAAFNGLGLKDKVDRLHRFACDNWDYRRQQREQNGMSGGLLERQKMREETFASEHSEIIMDAAVELGLVDITEPVRRPDFILPLGGARLTNYFRPLMARKVIDGYGWKDTDIQVVALTGTRVLTDTDFPYLLEYEKQNNTNMALEHIGLELPEYDERFVYRTESGQKVYQLKVMTEFDAMNMGLEKAFGVSANCSGVYFRNENVYLDSEIRRYKDKYGQCSLYSMVASSSDPENRRANSMDTFEGFVSAFDVKECDRLLLVTSTIYVPFQSLKFYKLGIEGGFDVDCIGVDDSIEGSRFSNATNYMQETKATIDAIYGLSEMYSEYIEGM